MKILFLFVNIRQLTFYKSFSECAHYLSFANESPMFSCSTLVEFHVNIYRLDDCLLLLLDGHLSQLRILFLTTFYIPPLQQTNISQVNCIYTKKDYKKNKFFLQEKVDNLRHFSLTCISQRFLYDEIIVPLLQRMNNLQKLALCLKNDCEEKYIDGNDGINRIRI